jgi:hypothetical protein
VLKSGFRIHLWEAQENKVGLGLNGSRQLLVADDVDLLGKNINAKGKKRTQKLY